ncbi:hypothetical protein X733_33190 [Mesorhizobium sp. L2C067A000]|nr:hypothetical protein X733_33190 [Mesorhizobium sp. L2C067A000]
MVVFESGDEDIVYKPVADEGAGADAIFGLDHHHQIGWVGRIVVTPDRPSNPLTLGELGHPFGSRYG